MRRHWLGVPMIILCLLLSACGGGEGASETEALALTIRGEYLAMSSCTAALEMTADHGQRVYDYSLDMSWQKDSGLALTVTAPEDLAGVTITAAEGQTALEYDGARIETGAITPDGLSPIDALPAFLNYAREGFMAACVEEELGEVQTLRVCYREPEGTPGTGVEASLWFDSVGHGLLRGELSTEGVTVIQCTFSGFRME